jgi:nucleoside-diphosphate-sugar epimerase
MKILLIGGNSSLAKVLHPLLSLFSEVFTAGRTNCDMELDMAWPAERFEIPENLDTVINLAAHFGGQDFESMLKAEEVNVLGSLKLAYACHRARVGQLIQISSIFAGLDKDSPFFNSYVLSKRHSEELLQFYSGNVGLPLAILRPAQIYGEVDSFRRHQPFLYAIMDLAQRSEEIVLFGRNDARRNFIHVTDVAEIISRVVQQRIVGCYECANMSNVRFSEMATAAVAAFCSSSTITLDRSKPDIPDNAFVADDALYRRIGYFPQISLAMGLALEAERLKALS